MKACPPTFHPPSIRSQVSWCEGLRSASIKLTEMRQVLRGQLRGFRDRCDCFHGTWYLRQPQTGKASHPDTHRFHTVSVSCRRHSESPEPTWVNTQFQHQAQAVWEKTRDEAVKENEHDSLKLLSQNAPNRLVSSLQRKWNRHLTQDIIRLF